LATGGGSAVPLTKGGAHKELPGRFTYWDHEPKLRQLCQLGAYMVVPTVLLGPAGWVQGPVWSACPASLRQPALDRVPYPEATPHEPALVYPPCEDTPRGCSWVKRNPSLILLFSRSLPKPSTLAVWWPEATNKAKALGFQWTSLALRRFLSTAHLKISLALWFTYTPLCVV